MSVFSFCATLIKNYKITVPDGSPLPDMKPNAGLTNRPKPFEIKLVKRCWFWYGICRWFFFRWKVKRLHPMTIAFDLNDTEMVWDIFPPPRNPNGPVFWLILRYLTYEGQHLYLFILCMYMLKNWLPMLIFIAFRCQCLLFINCTLLYCIYIEIYLYLCTACINIFKDKLCFNGKFIFKKKVTLFIRNICNDIYYTLYLI